MHLRRVFLWSMIVSLSLAAAMGIAVLLLGDFFFYDEEVLFSTALFGLYSLLALYGAIVLEKRRVVALMWVGIGCSILALGFWLVLIWFEQMMAWRTAERIAQTAGTLTTFAVVIVQTGLLVLPRFDRRAIAGVRRSTVGVSWLLAVGIVVAIWWFDWIDDLLGRDIYPRLLGVLGILTACGTVVTPILWKVQAVRRDESAETIPSRVRVEMTCPRCRTQQELRTGPTRCASCGLRITIAIEEPRCSCGYLLYRLEGDRCPECGRPIPESDRWAARDAAREDVGRDTPMTS